MTSDQETTNNKTEKPVSVINEKKRGRRPAEEPTFPIHSLKKSLEVIEAMEKNYAGDPTDPVDIADLLGTSLNSSSYRNLLVSSHRYGLSDGSYKADKIVMTALGKSIVEYTSDEGKNQALLQAFMAPDLFKRFLQKYDRKTFPRDQIMKNVLKNEFAVPHDRLEQCAAIIQENVSDYNLVHEKTQMLRLSVLSSLDVNQKVTDKPTEEYEDEVDHTVESTEPITEPLKEPTTKSIPKVFISHSKNENILQQLKTILEFGEFNYTVAEEEETAAIPIPDKVFGLMRQCNCAIINISADEEMKEADGKYRINENVLIEIGAAFVHYDKRVILLVDKRIELPSNLQGLYKCEYEGNELSFMVAMRLQKALTDFRKSI